MKFIAPTGPTALALAALTASAAPAWAASVTVDSQDRSVSVTIPAASDDDSLDISEAIDASDFGPFDATLDRTLTNPQPDFGFTQISSALASQQSLFGTSMGQFVADAEGSTVYDSRDTDTLTSADSDFSVTFTLDEAMVFEVSGFNRYTSTGGGASGSAVQLIGVGGEVFLFRRGGDDGPGDGSIQTDPFSDSGTLNTGTYTLTASSGVGGGIGGTSAGYDVSFTIGTAIPTPAALPLGVALLGGLMLRRHRDA